MAASASVLTQLREHMVQDSVDLIFEDSKGVTPLLAAAEMRAIDDGGGRKFIIPVEYDVGFNIGFGTTLATPAQVGRIRWEVDPFVINTMASWTVEDIDAAKGDDETFDVISSETDAKTKLLRKIIACLLAERGWGRVGTITAVTSSTVTVDPSVVNRIEIGMVLAAGDNEASGTLEGSTFSVTGTNPDTGVITLSGDPTGGTAWDVGDTLFMSGARQNLASPARLVATGIKGWVDPTAPVPSESFFGNDRSGKYQLGGHRVNGATYDSHESALIALAQRLFNYGSRADTCFVSSKDYEILSANKESVKVVFQNGGKSQYEIGYDGFTLHTPVGDVMVCPDAFIEQGLAWMGPFKNKNFAPFIAYSGDSLVNVLNHDGNEFRLKTDGTMGYQMALYSRLAYILPAPGKFGVVSGLPTA